MGKFNSDDKINENDFYELHFDDDDMESRLGGKQRFGTKDSVLSAVQDHYDHGVKAYPKRRVFGKLVDDIDQERYQVTKEEVEASQKHQQEKLKKNENAKKADSIFKSGDMVGFINFVLSLPLEEQNEIIPNYLGNKKQ